MEVAALIEKGLEDLGLSLPPGAPGRLARFVELLGRWNRGQNLTAITEPGDIVARHVLDSLAGVPWVEGARVLDVGTGAGLPGIPLAMAGPSRQFLLLDSRRKRIQFLLHAKQVLKLDNVTVVQARFEDYHPDRPIDTLTARAFATWPELIRRASPFVEAGARLVVWQRDDPSAGLRSMPPVGALRWQVHAVRVPGITAPRHMLVIEGSTAPVRRGLGPARARAE